MMDWKTFWTVMMPQIAILSIMVVVSALVIVKFSEPITINGLDKLPYAEGEVKDFLMIGQRFADTHSYDLKHFNCKNYSMDLKEIADELGFKTQYVEGCPEVINETDKCHAWLRLVVDFEPIRGSLTDYSKEYPDIRKVED